MSGCPKGVTNDKECNVFCVGVGKNLFAGGLDHLSIGDDYFPVVEGFLLSRVSQYLPARAIGGRIHRRNTYELVLLHH